MDLRLSQYRKGGHLKENISGSEQYRAALTVNEASEYTGIGRNNHLKNKYEVIAV